MSALVVLALVGSVAGGGAPAPAVAAGTSITSCSEAALRAAVAAGGTARFTVDCPALLISREIVIGSTLNVTIDGNGHVVSIDAQGKSRHFTVVGGQLTLIGLELKNGSVRGLAGVAGGAGAAGANGGHTGRLGRPREEWLVSRQHL